ncbi:Nicotinate dehydrogenase subunit A [subsurface metagenome]
MTETIQFELNGKPMEMSLDSERPLLWVLRSDMGLTGTKYGCGANHCGACIVLVDMKAVRSCVYPVWYIKGKKVITIEGLSKNGDLHPLQKAFIKHDALQCGFCTSGMIMNAYGLLHHNPQPTVQEIIQGMDHNLCRCGSYNRIIDAIQTAAKEMKGEKQI